MRVFDDLKEKAFLRIFKSRPLEKNIFLRLGIKGEKNNNKQYLLTQKFKEMKKVLSLMAVAALLLLNGCTNTSETPITDALKSAKKGWVMTSVKSVPAYQLSAGVMLDELYADGDYEHSTGFFYSYEKDDVLIFGENGVLTIDPGTLLPEDPSEPYQIATAATYTVDEAKQQITFQMPWEYDDQLELCSVVSYDKNQLVLKYTRNDDSNPAKSQNTFTITYVPAK